jgi:hypothetical protein
MLLKLRSEFGILAKKAPDLGQGFDPEVIPNQQRRLILKTMHLCESMAILTKNKRYLKNT